MTRTSYRISDLPVGKTKAYEEIRSGRLRAVKCGRLTLILADDYERWLKSLPSISPDPSVAQATCAAAAAVAPEKSASQIKTIATNGQDKHRERVAKGA